MIVLGIDPGLMCTGWGVIEDTNKNNLICTSLPNSSYASASRLSFIGCGVIKTNPKEIELGKRLNIIFDGVSEVIDQYQPNTGAIEDLYMNHLNPRSTLKLGYARGVAITAMSKKGLNVKEFAPTIVKKTVSGYGMADKGMVANRVMMILGKNCPLVSKDAADALAIAISGSCFDKLSNIKNTLYSNTKRR
jgi:crossover junction endodeoxyribonuclease RuvC